MPRGMRDFLLVVLQAATRSKTLGAEIGLASGIKILEWQSRLSLHLVRVRIAEGCIRFRISVDRIAPINLRQR